MAEAKTPFYVSFTHDLIPHRVDQSRSHPGPPRGAANRAGYTSITIKTQLTFDWERGPRKGDGRFPIFIQSVNVYFRLADFVIAISSDFTTYSCAYQVTLRHEMEAHIYDPIRIFHSYRDILIRELNAIVVPTRDAPFRVVTETEAGSQQAKVEDKIYEVVQRTRAKLRDELEKAKRLQDDPSSYRLVYDRCTRAQWSSGR
jgi:hypothetical protein